MQTFSLDSQLVQDTVEVTQLSLCKVLLMNDATYPWLILVPQQNAVSEIFDLSATEQQLMWQEVTQVAQLLHQHYNAHKINVATLGNVVKQLHVHIVVRYKDDLTWPSAVWSKKTQAISYTQEQLQVLLTQLRQLLT